MCPSPQKENSSLHRIHLVFFLFGKNLTALKWRVLFKGGGFLVLFLFFNLYSVDIFQV